MFYFLDHCPSPHADGHHILPAIVLSELNQLSTVPFIPPLSTPFFCPVFGHISFSFRAQNQPFFITAYYPESVISSRLDFLWQFRNLSHHSISYYIVWSRRTLTKSGEMPEIFLSYTPDSTSWQLRDVCIFEADGIDVYMLHSWLILLK